VRTNSSQIRVARWYPCIAAYQKPNLNLFLKDLEWKNLVNFIAILYFNAIRLWKILDILLPSGILRRFGYGNFWYILLPFGILRRFGL
jgi:hypothetical protein